MSAHGTTPQSDGVLAALERTRRTLRRALVVERAAQAIAFGFVAIAAAVLLDRLLRLPAPVRVLELVALLVGGALWFWRRVLPALRFSPPLVEIALRLERGESQARGTLAAGADFAQERGREPVGTMDAQARAEVVQRAGTLAEESARGRVDLGPARRAAAGAALALLLFAALAIASPETVRIALARLLTPFAPVQWPARTMVEAAMQTQAHPRGVALALRARAVRGDPASMRVEAVYRLLHDGAGEWREVLLSPQPDGSFERLVETDGDAIELTFRTEDMETAPLRIALVTPPAVERARVAVEPPEYARGSVDARDADLGTGTDRRAMLAPPVLAGSQVTLDLHLRGATAPPAESDARAAWLERTVRIAGAGTERIAPTLEVDPADPAHWRLRWNAQGRGVVELTPQGAEGIGPAERIAFEIPAVEDAPPTIAITEPAADEAVTPEATPLVVAEGRDDLRVAQSWIEVVGAKPLARIEGVAGPVARVEATLPLRTYGVQPGDRVAVTAYAVDAYMSDGAARAPVASTPRIFRIISASELSEQVRSRVGQLREAASRLREEQASIAEAARGAAERTQKEGAEATAAERTQLAGTQGRMSDRVAAFERALAELGGRLERNRTDGDGLAQSIQDAQRMAREAAKRAQEAAAALPQAAQAQDGAARAEESERALSELEAALERDRETAELARRIDRLAEQIAQAQRDVRSAEPRTVGRDRSQMDEATRAQLDKAAQSQREAAKEARALTDALLARAQEAGGDAAKSGETGKSGEQSKGGDQSQSGEQPKSGEASKSGEQPKSPEQPTPREQPDPGAAQAMREAAQQAQERGLARQLEEAARQTEQNQLQGAQQSQQQAQQAVQAMQQAMRNQQKARAEELRRRITSIVESLRALLGGIERAALPLQQVAPEDAPGVDASAKSVLALARNAAGIAQDAAGAGQQAQRVATLVSRAAEHLDGSAGSLRAAPPELPPAREQFDRARTAVQEALAAAQRSEQQAQREAENRRRAELRDLYAQVLERQRGARTATEALLPPPGKALDRRAFIEARRLGGDQGGVTQQLHTLGERPDIGGSALFSASHQQMEAASKDAAQELVAGAPSRRTTLLQKEVESSVAALMQALEDPPEQDDPFAQNAVSSGNGQGQQGGGAGGGGGAARLPPIAELRLLRTMAQQVLDDTRAATALPTGDREAYLGRVAKRQQRILELGEEWMKQMAERNPQNAPEGGTLEQQPAPAPKETP